VNGQKQVLWGHSDLWPAQLSSGQPWVQVDISAKLEEFLWDIVFYTHYSLFDCAVYLGYFQIFPSIPILMSDYRYETEMLLIPHIPIYMSLFPVALP